MSGALHKLLTRLGWPPRCVVYTCMFGYSERFNDFLYDGAKNIDFVCFTDNPELKSSFWKMRVVAPGILDPARAAKRIKALPHLFLPEYDWSLYIDNTVELKSSPRLFFDRFLARASSPYVCFRHPERACVYDEAEEIIRLQLDEPACVQEQMRVYRRLGYPAKNGLAKGAFILRRHHDPLLRPIMECWYEQILTYSKRDQLSLNPVMWHFGFAPTYLPIKFRQNELLNWPVVADGGRLPRDFDDERYLQLNPDVTSNPRRHFLQEGAAQGRHYK